MSSAAAMVRDLRQLLAKLAALLATQTAKEAPNIAKELGAQQQFDQAVGAVRGLLAQLKAVLVQLRQPLLNADTVLAGFEIFNAGLGTFGRGEAFTDIRQLLGLHDDPFAPLIQAVDKGRQALGAVLQLAGQLPSADNLKDFGKELEQLDKSLAALLADVSRTEPTGG